MYWRKARTAKLSGFTYELYGWRDCQSTQETPHREKNFHVEMNYLWEEFWERLESNGHYLTRHQIGRLCACCKRGGRLQNKITVMDRVGVKYKKLWSTSKSINERAKQKRGSTHPEGAEDAQKALHLLKVVFHKIIWAGMTEVFSVGTEILFWKKWHKN